MYSIGTHGHRTPLCTALAQHGLHTHGFFSPQGIRTYSVTPLSERVGLLEWVNNTTTARILIEDERRFERCFNRYPSPVEKSEENVWDSAVNRKKLTPVEKFRDLVIPRFPPTLQFYFQRSSSDPQDWFQRRRNYITSLACWSMLGYIVGLGDRHCENILVDTASGGVVHVDFDCLFGRGFYLAKAELVPFRLTQNLVAAMGVGGHSCSSKLCAVFL